MKTETLKWLVCLGAFGCAFSSCSEPATECEVGLAGAYPFVALYTPVGAPSPAGCEAMNPAVVQAGDLIGMEHYHQASDDGKTYNPNVTFLAIKTDWMGEEVAKYSYSCTPATCEDLQATCGPVADGCGGIALPADGSGTDCGSCTNAGESCGGGGSPNVCGTGTCTAQTCADLSFNCGSAGDGCGGTLDCGKCSDASDTCGGAGVPGQCGHIALDGDTSHTAYAFGQFVSASPDANNLCSVSGTITADQAFSSSPMPNADYPADELSYAWKDIKVYVTAATQGTQFSADMTLTENGCSADYHVVGIWPAVSCTDDIPDPNDATKSIGKAANADKCNPCAQPDKGIFVGSGISPDFPVTCKQVFGKTCAEDGKCTTAELTDPWGRDPFYCVLSQAGDPPVLNPNPPTCSQ